MGIFGRARDAIKRLVTPTSEPAPMVVEDAVPPPLVAKERWQLLEDPNLHVEVDRVNGAPRMLISTIGDTYPTKARAVVPLLGTPHGRDEHSGAPEFSPECDEDFEAAVLANGVSGGVSESAPWRNVDIRQAEFVPPEDRGLGRGVQSMDLSAMATFAFLGGAMGQDARPGVKRKVTVGYDAIRREHVAWSGKQEGRWPAGPGLDPRLNPIKWTRNTTPAFRAAVEKLRRKMKDD